MHIPYSHYVSNKQPPSYTVHIVQFIIGLPSIDRSIGQSIAHLGHRNLCHNRYRLPSVEPQSWLVFAVRAVSSIRVDSIWRTCRAPWNIPTLFKLVLPRDFILCVYPVEFLSVRGTCGIRSYAWEGEDENGNEEKKTLE